MKRVLTFFIAMILLSVFALAQTNDGRIIRGTIVDQSTGMPIPYVNIGIEGTFTGSASDINGHFSFSISGHQMNSSVFASAIGYKIFKIELAKLSQMDNIRIEMQPQSYGIEEVDISARSLFLYRVVRNAIESIPKNYLQKPFSLKAYYKSQAIKDNIPTRLLEANVDIYDASGYKRTTAYEEQVERNYRFLSVKSNFTITSLADGMTFMDELLDFDIVRSRRNLLASEFVRNYSLSLDQVIEYEGDSAWVISYELDNPSISHTGDYYATSYKGKIYITKADYAIVRNDTWVSSSSYSRHGRSFAVGDSESPKPVSINYKFTTTYRKKQGTYSLAYTKLHRENIWKDKATEKIITESYECLLLPMELPNTQSPSVISKRDYYIYNTPHNEELWEGPNTSIID